jgi:hypothetical protein
MTVTRRRTVTNVTAAVWFANSLVTISLIGELRTSLARTRSEPLEAGYLVSPAPAAPTISRRGVLAFAGRALCSSGC